MIEASKRITSSAARDAPAVRRGCDGGGTVAGTCASPEHDCPSIETYGAPPVVPEWVEKGYELSNERELCHNIDVSVTRYVAECG